MRKLRKGATVEVFTSGPSVNRAIYRFIRLLEIGDSGVISKKEWKGKTLLSHVIHNREVFKGKYSCRLLADKSGWLIEHIN